MNTNDVTAVIVTFKSEHKIFSCLDSIPSDIKVIIVENSDDAKSTARVIDLYKVDAGIGKKPRATKPTAASAITPAQAREVNVNPNGGKRIWKASEISRLKGPEFERFEKDIDLARAEGRIDFNS